jgi:hypothetical protein
VADLNDAVGGIDTVITGILSTPSVAPSQRSYLLMRQAERFFLNKIITDHQKGMQDVDDQLGGKIPSGTANSVWNQYCQKSDIDSSHEMVVELTRFCLESLRRGDRRLLANLRDYDEMLIKAERLFLTD